MSWVQTVPAWPGLPQQINALKTLAPCLEQSHSKQSLQGSLALFKFFCKTARSAELREVMGLAHVMPGVSVGPVPPDIPSFPCCRPHQGNGVLLFPRRYYKSSVVLMCFVIPTFVPWYLWGESLWNAYFLASILRYTISLNVTWLVNSAAHMYGNRPYDKYINPRQNTFVTLGAIGRCCSPPQRSANSEQTLVLLQPGWGLWAPAAGHCFEPGLGGGCTSSRKSSPVLPKNALLLVRLSVSLLEAVLLFISECLGWEMPLPAREGKSKALKWGRSGVFPIDLP